MMTNFQWIALGMQATIAIGAQRFSRVRSYLAFSLLLNLAKLALQQIDVTRPYQGVDLVIVLLEGLLFVAGPAGLAWALKAQWKAVAGFIWTAWVYVVLVWPRISGSTLLAFYMAVHLTAHVFVVGHTLWHASSAKKPCQEERLLLILAAVGLSGTGITFFWGRDDWGLVSAGNLLAYLAVGYFACIKRQEVSEGT